MLAAIGAPAVEALCKMLGSNDHDVRRRAAEILHEEDRLSQQANDFALSNVTDVRTVEALCAALADEDVIIDSVSSHLFAWKNWTSRIWRGVSAACG